MSDVGRRSTGSGRACERGAAGRSSNAAGERVVPDSPPEDPPLPSLRRRHDFERLYRSGRRGRSGPVTVIAGPGSPGRTRVGIVAGRKLGGAVRRNRAKRRLREAVRRTRLREGIDYVVIASAGVLDEEFENLIAFVRQATDRAERGWM